MVFYLCHIVKYAIISKHDFCIMQIFISSVVTYFVGSHITYNVTFGNGEKDGLYNFRPVSNQEYDLTGDFAAEGNFTVVVTIKV